MKNIINTYSTSLLILLNITHLPRVQAIDPQQQESWKELLVHLYYKGVSTNKRKDMPITLELFKNACNNITSVNDINKQTIKPKMLEKKSLSHKGYDLDVLKVYYLFTQKEKDEHLTDNDIDIGYEALQHLYYKKTRINQDKQKTMQEILESTEGTKTKSKSTKIDYKNCVVKLAQLLNKKHLSLTTTHSYNNLSATNLDTTRIHRNISQLKIQIKDTPVSSNNNKTLAPPLPLVNNLQTPEYSSDEEENRLNVEKFKLANPETLIKKLKEKKKNAFSTNDVANPKTFEQTPSEVLDKYQNSITLNFQQAEELKKLRKTNQDYQARTQNLEQAILNLKQKLAQKKTTPNQEDKSHALQYLVATIIGSFIGIAISQATHKSKEKKQEQPKERS